jgi:Flp pilus assembly pilin Flp
MMSPYRWAALRFRHWALAGVGRDVHGQDLIEYALLAGFIAVLIGSMVPAQIVPALCAIYSKVNTVLYNFNGN